MRMRVVIPIASIIVFLAAICQAEQVSKRISVFVFTDTSEKAYEKEKAERDNPDSRSKASYEKSTVKDCQDAVLDVLNAIKRSKELVIASDRSHADLIVEITSRKIVFPGGPGVTYVAKSGGVGVPIHAPDMRWQVSAMLSGDSLLTADMMCWLAPTDVPVQAQVSVKPGIAALKDSVELQAFSTGQFKQASSASKNLVKKIERCVMNNRTPIKRE